MVTVTKYQSYNRNAAASAAGVIQINHNNPASGAFRLVMVNNSYTFDNAHSAYSQLTGVEISAANYTSGGLVLTGVTYTIGASGTATFDAADTIVTASGTDMSAAGAVVRYEGGPLMFYIDYEAVETAGDGTTFTHNWSADGLTQIK